MPREMSTTDRKRREIGALIFDMDDLLVRSAPIWRAAEVALLTAIGQRWDAGVAARYKGMNALDVARVIHETYRPARPLADCQKIMRDTLMAGFAGQAEPMPGAVEFVTRVAGKFPLAVASGSPWPVITGVLETLKIREHFRVVVSSESVARGKPHPDVFLATAEALGAPPRECLVLEDSLIGVRAAKAAGMRCYSVPSGHHAEIAALADGVFSSLAEITLQ
jgi:HAD superfamily hydrolase (TIGR01509 family)